MAEPTKGNKTNQIKHDLLPDNTYTIILKVNGKVYSTGGEIGDKMNPDIADEDLQSTLRAINRAGISLQRTLAVTICGRDIKTYEVPGELSIEEKIESTIKMMKADEDIKKGDPVVVDEETQRARKATAEELGIEKTDEGSVKG